MAKTVRQLIQNAGLYAGITDIFTSFEPGEITALLNQLNNSLEEFSLEPNFSYTKNIYDVLNATSPITIGKERLKQPGISDTYLSGTITGLINTISSTATIPLFKDAVITLDTGEEYFIPGTSTMNAGIITGSNGGVYSDVPPSPTFTPPDITPGETITFNQLNLDTPEGVFTHVDVFADRPNFVKSVAVVVDGVYAPIKLISPDTYDDSYRTTVGYGTTYPSYAIYRTNFPIAEIEIYPNVGSNEYRITSEIMKTDYEINDEIDLPIGWGPVLEYDLAVQAAVLAGELSKLPQLEKKASTVLRKVKRMNNRSKSSNKSTYFSNRRSYNPLTDSFGAY